MALAMMIAATTAGTHAAQPALVGQLDSASYALGINVAMSLQQQITQLPGPPINAKLFRQALNSYLAGEDTTKMPVKPSKSADVLNRYMAKAQQEDIARAQAVNQAFLDNNKKRPGVITTASGLQYEIIRQGNNVKPQNGDHVKVNYTGTLTNGQIFDSNNGKDPVEFDINRVIAGWTEGLQLMGVGAKYRFYIPPELGYGNQAVGGVIPPYSILIFDVELLDVGRTQVQQPQRQVPQSKYSFKPYQR